MTHTEERLLPQNKAYYTTTTYRIYQKSNERVGRGMNELSICNMGRAGARDLVHVIYYALFLALHQLMQNKMPWENASSSAQSTQLPAREPTHQDTTPRRTPQPRTTNPIPSLYLYNRTVVWGGAACSFCILSWWAGSLYLMPHSQAALFCWRATN